MVPHFVRRDVVYPSPFLAHGATIVLCDGKVPRTSRSANKKQTAQIAADGSGSADVCHQCVQHAGQPLLDKILVVIEPNRPSRVKGGQPLSAPRRARVLDGVRYRLTGDKAHPCPSCKLLSDGSRRHHGVALGPCFQDAKHANLEKAIATHSTVYERVSKPL